MPGIREQSRKLLRAIGDKTKPAAQDSSVPRTRQIHPKRSWALGRHIAIALDSTSLQLATVAHSPHKKRIIDVRSVKLNESDTDAARDAILTETVTDYLKKFGGSFSRVHVAVSGRETAFRSFVMPRLKKTELVSAVKFEAQKQMPFPLTDCTYGFRPIYEIDDGQHRRLKMALLGATHRQVHRLLEPLRSLNVSVAAVHHTQDVIGQLLRHLPGFNDQRHATMINITPAHTEISIYRGANLEFFHISATGSAAPGTSIPFRDYEHMSETLASEILASLDYYAGQYGGSVTDRIYVYGDLSYNDELLFLLSAQTGVEFARFPAEELDFVPRQSFRLTDSLAVCLPVLASAACDVNAINLLPAADRRHRQQRRFDNIGRVGIVLLALILGGSWLTMDHTVATNEKSLVAMRKQVEAFKNSPGFHTYNIVSRQVAQNRKYLQQIQKQPSYVHLTLKALTHLTPPAIRLFHLSHNPQPGSRNLMVQGVAVTDEYPPEVVLAEFVENLERSPVFEEVTVSRNVKKQLRRGFELEFLLEMKRSVWLPG